MAKKNDPSLRSAFRTIASGVGEAFTWGKKKLSEGCGKLAEKLRSDSDKHDEKNESIEEEGP